MKKAYNEVWVDNIDNQQIIKEWHEEKMLSSEQYIEAKQQFPVGFYQPNIFVEIGLFLFTNIAVSATFGFLAITFFSALLDTSLGFSAVSFMYGAALIFLLEKFIKNKNLYRSGTDNALLYVAIGSFITFILAITDFKLSAYLYSGMFLIVLIPFLMRYGDPFVAIGLYATWIGFWYTLMIEFPIGKIILPFVIMIVSAIGYALVKMWRKKDNSAYYTDSQICIETACLITFYLGGNYYIVREGNAILNNLQDSRQIDFAPLFYIFTIFIPLLYLFFGLKRQDRKMVMVGILTFAFSIFTYREYNSTFPLEWVMTLGGLALIGFSIFCIWLLKTPRWGLTYQQSEASKYRDFEAFMVSQVLPHQGHGGKTKFGDGDFGGGGAGSGY